MSYVLHLLVFLTASRIVSEVEAQVSTIVAWPGYKDLRSCAQCPIWCGSWGGTVYTALGCTTDSCLCNHLRDALRIVSSLAVSSSCTGQNDIASATSIVSAFWAQLPGVNINPDLPVSSSPVPTMSVTTTVYSTVTATVTLPPVTLTPSCISS